MSDMIWSVLRWWGDWQLRILVLGSLGLQWFLLMAAPMRRYSIPRIFRACIWLAYISSEALAIYALATLFNRHGRVRNVEYLFLAVMNELSIVWCDRVLGIWL